jgi:hypothetical protein
MLRCGPMPPELTSTISTYSRPRSPELKKIWVDEGWQHHWWPERLGGVPLPSKNVDKEGASA